MWSQVYIVLFIFCVNSTTADEERSGWPGYQYHPQLQGWLKLHSEPTDYQYARIKCHLEDALIAADWNLEFMKAIVALIPSLDTEDPFENALYSGVQVTFSDGDKYKYIMKDEPILTLDNTARRERCIVFFANSTMGVVDCHQRYPFVCYAFAPKPTCGENSTTLGYRYSSETGHCYKYKSISANWTEAYEACHEEGAYLAVVNSNIEAQVLSSIFPFGPDYASIGFYYWKPAGSWWTIQSQTLQEAGFSKWKSEEPRLETSYGLIHRSGELASSSSWHGPYICEKHPTSTLNP